MLKPHIQISKALKVWCPLPQALAGILHVLLNLAFLPTRCWITELRIKQVVADHGSEPLIDPALFATPHRIHSGLHVVVDAALGNATEDLKGMPVGIKQHFMFLLVVSPKHKGPAVGQLKLGNLKNGRYLTYGGYQFVILAAPTRSGKGVGIVVPNCLNYSDSLVVLDIKGENFDITSGFRAKHGQKVYLFAPFDEAGVTHRYNPLEYISDDPAQRLGDIDAIGTALYSGGNQNDKFWSENAKDLFRGLCLFVLERKDLPKTFGEILRQASGKGKPLKEYIFEELKKAQDTGHPFSNACIDCLNRVLSNSENTLAGIVATFGTPLLIFQNPRVDLATSANDFDLREVRRELMSIYFKMPPNKLKEGSVLVNLFFDQLLNLNTRVLPSQDKTLKHQCLVLLDEMTSIGKVAMIAQAVSYMAGYNMRLLTIIQNKSQLEDVYGKAGALTLLSNHALMVMYAPSPTVQSDAQEYSEMLGYETVKSRSRTSSMQSSSTSTSDQRRALMLPQEIRELGQTREIVSLENCKPILCDKIRYYEDPDFTCRAHLPPPSIPKQDIDTFIAKIENRTRPMTAGEMAAPSEAAAKVVLEGLQELPQSAVAWGQDEVESFVDFDVQAALSSLTFAPRTEVPREISSDGIADQETKDALVADIFDVTDTDSNETSESLQNSGPATVADAITDLADHLTASEDEVAESSDELDTDTAAEDSADADTADLQRTLESIDALMNPTDATKAELPIEKFYSKTAVRDTRRVGS